MNNAAQLHLVVPGTLYDVRIATEKITGSCLWFSGDDLALFSTAVMEALVNIVKHSHCFSEQLTIEINVSYDDDAVVLVIEDNGCGMEPSKFLAASRKIDFDATNILTMPEAGMGIAIIKSVMDSVKYERLSGVNRLTAVRRWSK